MALYAEGKIENFREEIAQQAHRFKVSEDDVVWAAWQIARDSVWAKLKMDLKEMSK